MRLPTLLLICLQGLLSGLFAQESTHFTVMAWNILHGAHDIENGPQHAIEIIRELNPDVILMVETYGSGQAIADSLGYHFHLIAPAGTPLDDPSVNLSIISRYPFGERIDTDFPFYLGGREILIGGQKVRFFSNWFHYDPWDDAPEQLGKSAAELLEWEKTGRKYAMLQKVLPYFQKYALVADSIPMIVGGDMNAPSHLDWGPETQSLHNGLIVPWLTTSSLEKIGLIDTYRLLHPDPVAHPGITWDEKNRADEHRIDYIFCKGERLRPVSSQSFKAYLGESIQLGERQIPYPSDHGIVLTTFELH